MKHPEPLNPLAAYAQESDLSRSARLRLNRNGYTTETKECLQAVLETTHSLAMQMIDRRFSKDHQPKTILDLRTLPGEERLVTEADLEELRNADCPKELIERFIEKFRLAVR